MVCCVEATKWVNIRCRFSPAALEGHSASVVGNSMFVFGGCTDGAPQNTLWQFDFGQYCIQCVTSLFDLTFAEPIR